MSGYVLEGGPYAGRRVETDASVVRIPLMRPVTAVWQPSEVVESSIDYVEYRRVGRVYRYEGLIDDAWGEMEISDQVWRDWPPVRREARAIIRRQLQDLAPDKEVDRVVWVVGRNRLRSMFTLAGFVGGRRSETAARFRDRVRSTNG